MHELSIASAVLDAVRAEAARHPAARVRTVGLRVGELAGVNGEALRFCLEALVRETELSETVMEIMPSPRRHRCRCCQETFAVTDYQCACPSCASAKTDCVGGEELELAFLELEEG